MSKPFWWVNEESLRVMERGYLLPNQTIEEKVRIKAKYASDILGRPDLEEPFFNMVANGWCSLSSPIWANFGEGRGLPISCFSSFCEDSIDGIFDTVKEVAKMTQQGGGTSGYFPLRPKGSPISGGGKTSGAVSFIEVFDTTIKNTSQSGVRRGGFAAYMDIDHPEIIDFMRIKDKDSPMQSINTAVNVTDDFMNRMINGDERAREVWAEVLRNRREKGIPYISFIDNVNNQAPQVYKDKGLRINQSNLCNEIWLHTSEEESLVCCLSSLNLATYNEWKDTNVVELMTYFLDAVLTDFINKSKEIPSLKRATLFAERQRAIGIGVLGWHSFLQQEMIPFSSPMATAWTHKIFKQIKEQSTEASKKLALEYGEPELLKGYGVRNATTCVSGETQVLTDCGNRLIKDLVNKEVNVWNGFEYSKVTPYETGVDRLYRVTLSNGRTLDCTNGHIFKVVSVKKGGDRSSKYNVNNNCKVIDVPLQELRVGDIMSKFLLPVIDGDIELLDAYTQGFYSGDGSISCSRKGKYPRKEIRLYDKKMICKDRIVWKSVRECNYNGIDLIRGYINNDYEDKHFVPSTNYKLQSKLDWLAGIIDSDGSKSSSGISISMRDYKFALDIADMLQTMGCHSTVRKCKRVGGFKKDENSYYFTVNISIHSCTILNELGLKLERVENPVGKLGYNSVPQYSWVEVISIEDLNKEEMTYCFTESKNNTGVFNGVMTGQCAVAPTTSSSSILGQVSPGIEPYMSNFYTVGLAKGSFPRMNKELDKLLESKGKNTREVWKIIKDNKGSVQTLDFLTQDEKDVFKTFSEISPLSIIEQNNVRQRYVDQGVSLNVLIPNNVPIKDINAWYIEAWKGGTKGLYYQRGTSVSKEVLTEMMKDCTYCEA